MQSFTELYEVERRYEELAHRMSTPDAAANADEYARMMRDYKELTPLIEEYRRYTDLQQQEADAKEMLAAESDPAFAAMVQQELCEIGRNLAQSQSGCRCAVQSTPSRSNSCTSTGCSTSLHSAETMPTTFCHPCARPSRIGWP